MRGLPLHCLNGRVLEPELLDEAPPEPTRQNLRELVTINRLLGGHRILLDRLGELFERDQQFTFLDIGAASGDMADQARKRFTGLRPINLDRRALHLESAEAPVCGDAFRLPFADRSVDVTHCSLFLHHLTNEQVVDLIAEMYRVARHAVIVQDLERNPLPYYFLPATRWLFGWSPLVLHDGPISVEAAFKASELQLLARRAGLGEVEVRTHRPAFRVSFVARRG